MLTPSQPRFLITNQSKSSQAPLQINSIFIGRVVRATGGIYVNVPNLSQNQNFGPCKVFSKYPKVGDSVLVGFLEGKRTEMVVLGYSTSTYRLTELDDPINPQDAATKKYVDDEIAELRAWVQANFD